MAIHADNRTWEAGSALPEKTAARHSINKREETGIAAPPIIPLTNGLRTRASFFIFMHISFF
jgi:hypothetical protein